MNKKVGIIKRVLCLSLIFLLSINSFAAVVSDNDGSAFITKAEFDSLKNNFQAQIDQYNQGIDSKIDSAIAGYLSGVKLDEGKKYKIYGTDLGKFNGEKICGFYLIGLAYYAFCPNTTPAKACIGLVSATKTQRPGHFGEGLWVNWGHPNSTSGDIGTVTGLPAGAAGYLLGEKAWDTSVRGPYLCYSLSDTPQAGGTTGTFMMNLTPDSSWNYLYQRELSDEFQQLIHIYHPLFTLYEFLDSGSVYINLTKIINGKKYEGGSHGGKNTTNDLYAPLTGDVGQFILQHADGSSQALGRISTFTDQETKIMNFDVVAGDKFCFSIDNDVTINGNFYSILYYTKEIPGWVIETS